MVRALLSLALPSEHGRDQIIASLPVERDRRRQAAAKVEMAEDKPPYPARQRIKARDYHGHLATINLLLSSEFQEYSKYVGIFYVRDIRGSLAQNSTAVTSACVDADTHAVAVMQQRHHRRGLLGIRSALALVGLCHDRRCDTAAGG
jgi:hypothetical protein